MQVSLLMLWLLPFPWWVRATDPNLFTGNHFMETLLLAQNFCSIIHSEWVISSLWAEVTVNAQDVNKMKRGGQRAKTAFQIKMNVLCTCSLLSTVMSHGAPSSQLPHLTPLPPWKEIWHELTKSFNSQWVIPTPQCVDFSGLVSLYMTPLKTKGRIWTSSIEKHLFGKSPGENKDRKSKVRNHGVSVESFPDGKGSLQPPNPPLAYGTFRKQLYLEADPLVTGGSWAVAASLLYSVSEPAPTSSLWLHVRLMESPHWEYQAHFLRLCFTNVD